MIPRRIRSNFFSLRIEHLLFTSPIFDPISRRPLRGDGSKTLVLFTLRSRSISFLGNLITWACTLSSERPSCFLCAVDLRESIRREKRREKRIPHVGGMNDVASESRSGVDKVEEKKERNETWCCTGRRRAWLMRSCREMVSKRTIMWRGKVRSGESVGKTKRGKEPRKRSAKRCTLLK